MLEQFQSVGREMAARGLTNAGSGNLSIRQGDSIFITRRGSMLPSLTAEDIIETGIEPSERDENASRELIVHRSLYKDTNAKAVVHAHPPYAIVMAMNEGRLVPLDAEGLYYYASIPIIRCRQTIGSEEVAQTLPQMLKGGYKGAIIRTHGVFTIADTLTMAYQYAASLENSCQILFLSKMLEEKKAPPSSPPSHHQPHPVRRPAIPPGIGVMDRHSRRRR